MAGYLPFGGVHVSTGANIDLRFPGQWFQSESGLYQNWMRDYDPTTGRYMQADPLGLVDGASIYGYAHQNPGRFFDFRGEDGCYTDIKSGKRVCLKTSDTYCPSGECGFVNPTENVGENSEFAQCKRECEKTFDLQNFGDHGGACMAIGFVLGLYTSGGPLVSIPTKSMCADEYCTNKCGKQCGLFE